MCLGGPDTSGMQKAMQEQADAQEEAIKLQKQATAQAEAANRPAEDSESAVKAGEDRMRKLMENLGPGKKTTGAGPIGYRMLTGA